MSDRARVLIVAAFATTLRRAFEDMRPAPEAAAVLGRLRDAPLGAEVTAVRILAAVCALLFAALTAVIAAQPDLAIDLSLRWPTTQRAGWLDLTATLIRFAAGQLPLVAVLPLTAVLWWHNRRRDGLLLLTSFAAVLLTSVVVKPRDRAAGARSAPPARRIRCSPPRPSSSARP